MLQTGNVSTSASKAMPFNGNPTRAVPLERIQGGKERGEKKGKEGRKDEGGEKDQIEPSEQQLYTIIFPSKLTVSDHTVDCLCVNMCCCIFIS